MWQSTSKAETFLRRAKEKVSQYDIIENLVQAIDELTREVKRIDNDVQRIRREVQARRRF